jgi:hypothetical protein
LALKVNIFGQHTGIAMTKKEVADLNSDIDIDGLRNYCLAVGRRIEEIVRELETRDLEQKVEAFRLDLVIQ